MLFLCTCIYIRHLLRSYNVRAWSPYYFIFLLVMTQHELARTLLMIMSLYCQNSSNCEETIYFTVITQNKFKVIFLIMTLTPQNQLVTVRWVQHGDMRGLGCTPTSLSVKHRVPP